MSEKIRILIVDDHDEVRKSLGGLLAREEDIEVIGECANGKEALISAVVRLPDIIIMDIRMPIVDGLEAAHILAQKSVSCKVIIMTLYEQYLDEAIKSGVRGYLLKGINLHDLTKSIRSVHQGEIVIDGRITSPVEIN